MAGVDLSGKWKLDREENFKDLLKTHSVEKTASHLGKEDEYLTIEQLPGKLKMTSEFGGRKRTNEMNIPGETLVPIPGGHTKWTSEWQGTKLVVNVSKPDPSSSVDPGTTTREIVDGELVVTHEFSGITAKKIFKRA